MNPLHHKVKQRMYHKKQISIHYKIILISQTAVPLIMILHFFQILHFLRPLRIIRIHQLRIAQMLLYTPVVPTTRQLQRDIRINIHKKCHRTHHHRLLITMFITLQRVIFHIEKIQLIHNIFQMKGIILNILQAQDLTIQGQRL